MLFVISALAGVIAFILYVLLACNREDAKEEAAYQRKLKDVYEYLHTIEAKIVTLDFNAFKSVFELNPDDWSLRISGVSFVYFSRYVSPGDRYYILLKTKKDQKAAAKLHNDYHKEKEQLIKNKTEMKDFESFKQLIQQDIEQKKENAENELSKARKSLEETLSNIK